MEKRSQINFGETFGIIFITFIIIFLGLLFFNNIINNNIEQLDKENEEKEIFLKYKYILNLENLKRTENGIIREEFDILSLRSLKNILNNENDSLSREFRRKIGKGKFNLIILNNSNFSKNISNILIYNNSKGITLNCDVSNIKTLIPTYNLSEFGVGIFEIIFYNC